MARRPRPAVDTRAGELGVTGGTVQFGEVARSDQGMNTEHLSQGELPGRPDVACIAFPAKAGLLRSAGESGGSPNAWPTSCVTLAPAEE